MAGTFQVGEVKVRPGAYVRTFNAGSRQPVSPAVGVLAMVLKASSGPLGVVTQVDTVAEGHQVYGSALGTPMIDDAFNAGIRLAKVVRVGTGGTAATYNAMDSVPSIGVVISGKSVGLDGNDVKTTIRDSVSFPTTKRELLVYHLTDLVETWVFDKAPAGSTESDSLVASVGTKSTYVAVTRGAGVGPTLATYTSQPLVGGVNPVVVAADYVTAFGLLEPNNVNFNVLAIDSEVPAVQVSLQTFVDRVRGQGKLARAVVGEPTTVAWATRKANASAFNDPAVLYVGNGFTDGAGNVLQGYRAAAALAGIEAAKNYTDSLTHRIVTGATGTVNAASELTNTQVEDAIKAGMVVFTLNQDNQVWVESGVTTLVTLNANQDAGWKKEKRTSIRDTAVSRLVGSAERKAGAVNNDALGQAVMQADLQAELNRMVTEGAFRPGPRVGLDPANPSVGDSQFWLVQADDIDSGELFFIAVGWRYAPAA